MPFVIWAVGGALMLLAGVISFAMTRRYGWGAALALPLLALVAMVAMQWQEQGLDFAEGLRMAASTVAFAGPILLGVVAGIALARLRRGRG